MRHPSRSAGGADRRRSTERSGLPAQPLLVRRARHGCSRTPIVPATGLARGRWSIRAPEVSSTPGLLSPRCRALPTCDARSRLARMWPKWLPYPWKAIGTLFQLSERTVRISRYSLVCVRDAAHPYTWRNRTSTARQPCQTRPEAGLTRRPSPPSSGTP